MRSFMCSVSLREASVGLFKIVLSGYLWGRAGNTAGMSRDKWRTISINESSQLPATNKSARSHCQMKLGDARRRFW